MPKSHINFDGMIIQTIVTFFHLRRNYKQYQHVYEQIIIAGAFYFFSVSVFQTMFGVVAEFPV